MIMFDNIENYEKIRSFMDFSDPEKFYLIHVIQRKKDIPDLDRSERIVKTYTIPSIEYLDRIFPEIKAMCDLFNARAYMYINRRSLKGTAKAMLKKLADTVIDGSTNGLSRLYQSCASAHSAGDGYWIIDLDIKQKVESDVISEKEREDFEFCLVLDISLFLDDTDVMPEGKKTVMALKTKNGLHIITKRFDTRRLEELYNNIKEEENLFPYSIDVELKKDAMINLYIPIK